MLRVFIVGFNREVAEQASGPVAKFFAGTDPPASTWIGVQALMHPAFLVEIDAVAVIDAPSDHQDGMNAIFRMSGGHAADIGTVAAWLKKEAGVPVWLVGTSMGTFSAAGGAIARTTNDASSATGSSGRRGIVASRRTGRVRG